MKKNNRLSAIWVRSLFLGIAFTYHGLPVSAQQLHIESKSQSLKSIMQQIEKQSGYSFLYDEKTINLNRKVSLQMTGSLTQILQSLEQQTYLQLRLSGRNILINNGSVGVLTGKVTDETGLPLSLVSVFFKELNQYFLTEQDGSFRFQFPAHRLKSAEVRFSMIGRQGITLNVALDKQQTGIPTVTLPLLSVGLDEITVSPRTNQNLESNSSLYINREVIEQSGALSLNDLLSLVPGQKIAAPSLQQVQQANLRSASFGTNSLGTKDPFSLNNSFGIALIMDGIALSNNANMQTLNPGISGMGNSYVGGNISGLMGSEDRLDRYTGDYTFGGVDLRQIATDNIESVEIVAGISSAKYGDMTNGAVIINRIAGATPFNFNMQLRDNATVYGLTKGFQTKKWGAFTVGGNFTRSYNDNRDKLKSYDRVGSNLIWSTAAGQDRAFTNTFTADYGRNLDNVRRDPDDPTATLLRYRAYNFSVGNRTNYRIDNSFLTNIGFNVRYSETYQNTYKEQFMNNTYIIYTDATDVGVTNGKYASGIYTAVTNLEGKPVDFTARLDLNGSFHTGGILHQLNFGSSYNFSKNKGRGQIVDPTRPRNNTSTANGDNRSERYYDYSRIHAQNQIGFYAEDVFRTTIADRNLHVRIGTRLDLFEGYATFSPRTNINYEITPDLRIGLAYGWGSKAPALAQLYPGPVFYEIPLYQRTAVKDNGAVDEANSLYLLYVDKFTPDNSKLKPALSEQLELSLSYEHRGFRGGLNVYSKRNYRDIYSEMSFSSILLGNYIDNPDQEAELPYVIDGQKRHRLSRYNFVNGKTTKNQGIEVMLSTPKWTAIATSFNLRGGITNSIYNPVQNWLSVTNNTNNPNYAVTGLYPVFERSSWTSNAALTSSTHIPKAKLLLNFTTEFNILNKTNTRATDGIPIGYFTQDGRYYEIDNFDKENVDYAHLLRPIEEINNQNQPGVYTNFHLNLSKEIIKRLTLAFHVYNVFNYRPQYKRSDNTMVIPNGKPSYGAQVRLKL